jgi:alginate O-acetyltransferase complex protein AlgJ
MYLRTDTHWTPQGARTAADVLAQAIVPLLVKHGSTRLPFSAHDAGERVVEGDLLKFIPLGPWQRLGPAPDRVTQTVTTLEGDSAASDLFADLDIPVALTGTSYSIAAVSDFEGALKVALQADVLNVAAEGQGPFAPMEAYLASTAIDEARPAVVVWEIPERYLESEK